MRRLAMWLVWNVNLGRLAPWVFGFAIGSKPRRVSGGDDASREGTP